MQFACNNDLLILAQFLGCFCSFVIVRYAPHIHFNGFRLFLPLVVYFLIESGCLAMSVFILINFSLR